MTDTETVAAPPATLAELGERLSEDVARIDRELVEVDLLVTQAKTEAGRHETRRASAADKLAAMPKESDAAELVEANAQLINLTKRAALMESQVDVLDGKRRALARHQELLATYASFVAAMDPATATVAAGKDGAPAKGGRKGATATSPDGEAVMAPAVARMIVTGQEDMRREIARAMHDGPAQSLTNIVLQAQIVERLVTKDPAMAQGEVKQLIAMVQQTLDATKTFIFDVRPMVLDDLGLVPTLRRAARDRGQKAGITIDLESMGQERRLPMDLESGLYRMLDEAIVAYLERAPDRLSLRVDWSPERVETHMVASRDVKEGDAPATAAVPPTTEGGKDLPPALAAMMEDRRADARDAAEVARKEALVGMPPTTWLEIQGRAASLGIQADLLEEGSELHLIVESPIGPDA